MPKFFLDKTQLLSVFLTALLTILFFLLATHCYYSDSEIWLLALSQRVFESGELISIYFKWLFHVVTKMASFFVNSNLDLYTATRCLYAAIALAALAFNALAFSTIFDNKKLFLPLMVVTLTSSLFFNQGFRIRADILALLFHSLFVGTVVRAKILSAPKIAALTFLNFAMLLTTPKSLLFLGIHSALGCFFLFISANQTSRSKGRAILLSVFIPCTLGLLSIIILSMVAASHPLILSLKAAADFYIKSFDPGLGGAAYFHAYDFMYLERFFKSSVVHTFLFIFWFFVFFRGLFFKTDRSELHIIFDLSTALLIIFIFLYNQKLPFFLGPFLTPVLAHQFCVFWLKVQKLKQGSYILCGLLFIGSALSVLQFTNNWKHNSNTLQRTVIAELESFKKKNPQKSIYDVIGLLPLNNSYYFFMGPGEVSRRHLILSEIKKTPPDIYLYTLKNVFFEPELTSYLESSYWQSQPGVWLKAQNIKLDNKDYFTNQILQINNRPYWLTPTKSMSSIFSSETGKDITSLCYFLDQQKQVSQTDIFWVAIPIQFLKISVVELPILKLSANPSIVFRFDTSF